MNGSQDNPVWKDGLIAEGKQGQIIADIKATLDLAEERGMYIMPCLWSFDMLASGEGDKAQAGMTPEIQVANFSLLSEQAVRESYINNFLNPLLDVIAGHPALIGIDLFNEPENMTEAWFNDGDHKIPSDIIPTYNDIHTTTAVFSAAIHKKADELDKEVLVTTGPKSLGLLNADGFGGENYYSDTNMLALGGAGAELDFYAPHYYDDQGKQGDWSPFYHKASYWNLNKPVIIGEFFADVEAHKPAEFNYFGNKVGGADLCERVNVNEYAGALAWQWTNKYQESVLACVRTVYDTPAPVLPPYTGLYSFDDSNSIPRGIKSSSETGQIDLDIASGVVAVGNALELIVDSEAIENSEGQFEKKAMVLLPVPSEDKPGVAEMHAWVYIPKVTFDKGFTGGKLFLKQTDYKWNASDWQNVPAADEWTLFTWKPDPKLGDVLELGIEIYAGTATAISATDASVYIKNISVLSEAGSAMERPEIPVDEVDPELCTPVTGNANLTYDFEDCTVATELKTSSDSTAVDGSDDKGTAKLAVKGGGGEIILMD